MRLAGDIDEWADHLGILGSWRDAAACRGMPLDVFFPAAGVAATEARAICNSCPVKTDCLSDVMRHTTTDDPAGVRGGLRARERAALRAHRRRQAQTA